MNALTRRNDNSFLNSWQKEMNNLIQRFNRDFDLGTNTEEQFPKIEIKERNNGYLVKAEIPGMEEKDLTVSLEENQLILEGEKKSETTKDEKGRYFSEISYGSFYRSIPLQGKVNPDSVKASYKNGVLSI